MSKVEIDVTFPDWKSRLKQNEDRINRFIAADIQTNRGMMFDQEGAYNGHERWAPLKYREGQILSKTGTLRRSIAPTNSTGVAGPSGIVEHQGGLIKKTTRVGTKVAYARIHNEGGVIRPKTAKALRFKVRGKWVFAQEVKIPKRNFDAWNAQDAANLEAGLVNLITEILNGN